MSQIEVKRDFFPRQFCFDHLVELVETIVLMGRTRLYDNYTRHSGTRSMDEVLSLRDRTGPEKNPTTVKLIPNHATPSISKRKKN